MDIGLTVLVPSGQGKYSKDSPPVGLLTGLWK